MEDFDQSFRNFTSLDSISDKRNVDIRKGADAEQVEVLHDIEERLFLSEEEVIRSIYFLNLENFVKNNKAFYEKKHANVFPVPIFFLGDEVISSRMQNMFMKIFKDR